MPSSIRAIPAADRPESALRHRSSLGDLIYESLLERLISLQIAPGSRIAIDGLVRELGVSQTPIRAALIRLESEGLVEKKHNIGYSAAPLPMPDQFAHMYDIRLLLEPYTARLAADNMGEQQREQLVAIADSMANLSDMEDARKAYGKFAQQDALFHAHIAEGSGNTLAAEALARLYAHMHLFRLRFHSVVTGGAVEEHALIVKAILQRDAQGAAQAMHEHIERSRQRLLPYFR